MELTIASSCRLTRRKLCLNKELRLLRREREQSPKKNKKDLPRNKRRQRKPPNRLNGKEKKPKL